MRIYTRSGDLAFEEFTFPDGQPHFKLLTFEREWHEATIEMAIKSPLDLFRVKMACDVLHACGYINVNLDIRYLMGARMDRRMSRFEPFTLEIVNMILAHGFNKIRVFDVHNPASVMWQNVLPVYPVKMTLTTLGEVALIVPDAGAKPRVDALMRKDYIATYCKWFIQGIKKRDPATGKIVGMEVENLSRVAGETCLIVDDICDGGATFIELAKILYNAGAKDVHLYVTHLIMSKGHKVLEEAGIRRVFCTDSYRDWSKIPFTNISCMPLSMENMK